MVIGLFSSPNHAAVCLSNLSEADFTPEDISVVAQTTKAAQAIAAVAGPFSGLTVDQLAPKLANLGLTAADVTTYQNAIKAGSLFIAVSAADDAAQEMLKDHGATNIRVLKGG